MRRAIFDCNDVEQARAADPGVVDSLLLDLCLKRSQLAFNVNRNLEGEQAELAPALIDIAHLEQALMNLERIEAWLRPQLGPS